MKKRERTSYAFLMEMMWVCAFFLVCACIFVMAFAKAEQMSRKAETLNRSSLAASNTMEEIYAAFDDAVDKYGVEAAGNAGFDGDSFAVSASQIGSTYSTEQFSILVTTDISDGLLSVTVQATDPRDGEVLCTLNGARVAVTAPGRGTP